MSYLVENPALTLWKTRAGFSTKYVSNLSAQLLYYLMRDFGCTFKARNSKSAGHNLNMCNLICTCVVCLWQKISLDRAPITNDVWNEAYTVNADFIFLINGKTCKLENHEI